MASIAQHRPRPPGRAGLAHIPGEWGLPVLGNTLASMRNMRAYTRHMYRTFGPVYRHRALLRDQVSLIGPEANEFFFMDRDQALSSEQGWWPFLKDLFPRGLITLDFDEHKVHRKILAVAFKTPAMKRYCERLGTNIPPRIAAWGRRGEFRFYDAIKALTLDMASEVFLGLPPGEESARVNRALTDMVAATVTAFRHPLPGTTYGAGVAGRRFLCACLGSLVADRRQGRGEDTFTLLCHATDEDGNRFTDQQVVDHMNLLWMAAHDTVTSSITTLVYELARHQDWQDRLREEVSGIGSDTLDFEALGRLVLTEQAFKEALRLNAPVPAIPRRAVKDITFGGYDIPAGTLVGVLPTFVHHIEELWPEPERFDPLRFSEEGGARERHKYAWVPFGGGAHMCIGLHFAYMQAKLVMFHLLRDWRILPVRDDYTTEFSIIPLTRPKDGLPIRLAPLCARSG